MNQERLVKITADWHFKETFVNDLKFDANPKRTSERRELLDCVSRLQFEKEDSEIILKKLKRDVERCEDKLDHLNTMAGAEAWRGLRERKEEYLRKQGGQKKPIKIKRSRYRKHHARRFNGTNSKSRGLRNAHTCEKVSCAYIMQELEYNKAGLARHKSCEEFLHLASEKKAGMDRLDEVCHLRKNEDSLQNDTELHRMCVAEQTKWVQDMNEVGPKNVGTISASQAYLVRPINDPSKFFQIPNYKKSVEDRIEEELDRFDNMGVFAANADTGDVYFTDDEDSDSKKGAGNESDEENMFDSDGEQGSD